MVESLLLPAHVYEKMLAHARAHWPAEACGLLRGHDAQVRELLPARNIAADPRHNFQVDAKSLLQALSWEDEGDAMLAIYHSHPRTAAFPSAVDAASAFYPDSVYLILSLQDWAAPQLRGFFLRPEVLFDEKQAQVLQSGFEQVRPGLWSRFLAADAPLSPTLADAGPGVTHFYLIYQTSPRPPQPLRLVSVQSVPVTITL
jgi:proteasome lid subunit RPN8/RPN11